LLNTLEKQFDKLSRKIKNKLSSWSKRLKAYFKRLLFPIYLFPIKLITYSIYYLIKFTLRLIWSLIKILFETIIYPFRSLKNFLKSVFILVVVLYLLASLMVILDYLETNYGNYEKFFCAFGTRERLKSSVVRIVGGYSEGSGFFIDENRILTNFHVIDNEPSPKVILPDGNFLSPVKIVGDQDADLAVIYVAEKYPDLVLPLPYETVLVGEEPLLSAGYPLGTELNGAATVMEGKFDEFRKSKYSFTNYIQTNFTVVEGMSGGPLTDKCGEVVGINTLGVAGLSLFISASDAKTLLPTFTDRDIKKIEVDPSKSPEDAVRAFYMYLKARRMQDGFNLLSSEYLKNTDFEEWTGRFKDILDVSIYKSERFGGSRFVAFVKFSTKNWVGGEAEMHYYEGTWLTVLEDGVYKMLEADIVEVGSPGWEWFYE